MYKKIEIKQSNPYPKVPNTRKSYLFNSEDKNGSLELNIYVLYEKHEKEFDTRKSVEQNFDSWDAYLRTRFIDIQWFYDTMIEGLVDEYGEDNYHDHVDISGISTLFNLVISKEHDEIDETIISNFTNNLAAIMASDLAIVPALRVYLIKTFAVSNPKIHRYFKAVKEEEVTL